MIFLKLFPNITSHFIHLGSMAKLLNTVEIFLFLSVTALITYCYTADNKTYLADFLAALGITLLAIIQLKKSRMTRTVFFGLIKEKRAPDLYSVTILFYFFIIIVASFVSIISSLIVAHFLSVP